MTEQTPLKKVVEGFLRLVEENAGSKERLEFLRNNDLEPLEIFEGHEFFKRVVGAERAVQHLEGAKLLLQHFRGMLPESSLGPEEREESLILVRHLVRVLEQRQKVERQSEIELLSELWGHAPDLRRQYPWLTAWTKELPVEESENPSKDEESPGNLGDDELPRAITDQLLDALADNVGPLEGDARLDALADNVGPLEGDARRVRGFPIRRGSPPVSQGRVVGVLSHQAGDEYQRLTAGTPLREETAAPEAGTPFTKPLDIYVAPRSREASSTPESLETHEPQADSSASDNAERVETPQIPSEESSETAP